MNNLMASMIATLLIFSVGAATAQTTGDGIAEPQPAPASAAPIPAAENAATDERIPEPVSTEPDPPQEVGEIEVRVPAAATETEKASEPITGAFGIPLGEPFLASMVARVLGEQEQTYRGKDGAQLKGTLYRVKPNQPDDRFQNYSVKTTDQGVVYAILGDYRMEAEDQQKGSQQQARQDEITADESKPKQARQDVVKPDQVKVEKAKRAKALKASCKAVVKTLAGELEAKYGKPRGQGRPAEWFAFRQLSDTVNKSIRLYGHRCRSGMYSVVYTDLKLLHGLPEKAVAAPKADDVPTQPGPPPEAEKSAPGTVSAQPAPAAESGAQTEAESSAKP